MPLSKPRRLAPGQTIGLVAPSSAPNEPERIRFAAETIESLGFRVRPGAHLRDRDGSLAGTDATRAHDLYAMVAHDAVDPMRSRRAAHAPSRLPHATHCGPSRRTPNAL